MPPDLIGRDPAAECCGHGGPIKAAADGDRGGCDPADRRGVVGIVMVAVALAATQRNTSAGSQRLDGPPD
jgi:hypothetical protein